MFTINFWIVLIVVGNILFFTANVMKPVAKYVEEAVTLGRSSSELMESVDALEDASGVPMEQWIDKAVENFESVGKDVANTDLRTQRIEAALVNPLIHYWSFEIRSGGADCLGSIEAIFRKNSATRILSGDRFRHANFVGSAGFVHAFAAMCLDNHLAVFATGYNSAGTEELFEDIIQDVQAKWPPSSEPPPEQADE